jgi:hypothetical protein
MGPFSNCFSWKRHIPPCHPDRSVVERSAVQRLFLGNALRRSSLSPEAVGFAGSRTGFPVWNPEATAPTTAFAVVNRVSSHDPGP